MSAPALRPYNVLFLCTGSSCRSIMAEAIVTGSARQRRLDRIGKTTAQSEKA